jgi:single-stranded-DNA-specific exonuclease
VLRDRRGGGAAGTIAALVASGDPVLVVCADVGRRLDALASRLGGFALCSWTALERDLRLAAGHTHVVALDPPAHEHLFALLRAGSSGQMAHLAWGEPEVRFVWHVHQELHHLRPALADLYRVLRGGDCSLEEALRGAGPRPRSVVLAGRLLRVLVELGLVELDREAFTVAVPAAERTELERSHAFRWYESRRVDGERWLTSSGRAVAA